MNGTENGHGTSILKLGHMSRTHCTADLFTEEQNQLTVQTDNILAKMVQYKQFGE